MDDIKPVSQSKVYDSLWFPMTFVFTPVQVMF